MWLCCHCSCSYPRTPPRVAETDRKCGNHAVGEGGGRPDMPRLSVSFDMTETEWFDDAACRDVDTDIFFPVSESQADAAKAICAVCPVREECLEYALETRPGDGVYGGLTPTERHRLIRRRQKAARKQREARPAA